jgi:PAS domain S-box-containing protein
MPHSQRAALRAMRLSENSSGKQCGGLPFQTVRKNGGERLQAAALTGRPHFSEDEFIAAGGTHRTARMAVTAVRDGLGRTEHFVVEGQDITQSRLTTETLREKEAMLSSAHRLAKLGGWSWIVATDHLTWSAETFRIFGLSQNQLDNLNFASFFRYVHPDDIQHLKDAIERALAGQRVFSYQYRFMRDGEEKLIRGDGETHFDSQGRVCRLVGTVVDVTEQEQARQALEYGKARLRSLAGSSSEWYWEQDDEFRFKLFAGGRQKDADTLRPGLIGKRRWEVPECTPISCTWEEHKAALREHRAFHDFEYRVGAQRFISVSGTPVHGENGSFVGYRGTARDISLRKLAEERSRSAQSLLELATRLGRLGAWEIELPERSMTLSSEVMEILEVETGLVLTLDGVVALFHPDARRTADQVMRDCIHDGIPFDIELRARTARGRDVWLRLIGEAWSDSEGRVARVHGAVQDISERKEAAERYRELSERLVNTLESVTDAFFTLDREWRFSYVNHEAERLLQRPQDALLGKVIWELFPMSVGTTFHRQYERALAEFSTVRFEDFSGSLGKWLQVSAYPSAQGLAVSFRDVTESRAVRDELVNSEERYRLLFETSVDGILQTSPDGTIIRANSAACSMFALTEDEIRKRTRADLVAADDPRLEPLVAERARLGGTMGQLTMLRGDGSRFEAEITSSMFRTRNRELLSHIVLRDVTERIKVQQEVLTLNAELGERVAQRTAELELANTELKGFAHSLAHDLRAPIAAITGFCAPLQDLALSAGTQRQQHYVRRIQAAAQRMDEFIEALLSLATVSQAKLQMTTVDVSEFAKSILAELMERDGQRVAVTQVQEGLHAFGDPRLLRMVLENLLGNAWKFTAKRGAAEITFSAQVGLGQEVVYSVKDNGAGFNMAYAQKLFGNFQRLHRETEFAGTGIGLANVQRIILRHGGRVWAESVEGEGATFNFTLGVMPPIGK